MTSFIELTGAEFDAALEEIGRRAQQGKAMAPSQSRAAVAQKTLELLSGMPHLYDAGITEGQSVWLRLVNGTPVVILLDREPLPPSAPDPLLGPWETTPQPSRVRPPAWVQKASDGEVTANVLPQLLQTAYGLPKSEKAWIPQVDNLGPRAQGRIRMMLTKQKYVPTDDARTRAFRDDVKDIGVLWISTHGATYINPMGRSRFGIVAGESINGKCSISPTECQKVDMDIKADRAMVGTLNSNGKSFLLVNSDWVRAYWTLAENAIVFIDACQVLDQGPAFQEFQDALRDVMGSKKGSVLGWTGFVETVFAERAASWFFGRMLGSDVYLPPTPKQRPFSAPEVHASMARLGKTVDSGYMGATLKLTKHGAEDGILAPSIRNMTVEESKRELHLFGEFGNEREVAGTIEIDGQATRTINWDHTKVVVAIADSGPTSKGPVVAKFRGDQLSNAAPLTDWQGTARLRHTYDGFYGPAGPFYELNCSKVHFRADVHPFRIQPDGAAVAGAIIRGNVYDPDVAIMNVTADSKCQGSAGGSGDKGTDNSVLRTSYTLSARDIPWADQQNTPQMGNWFFGLGRINPTQRRLVLGLSSLAFASKGLTVQVIAPMPGKPFSKDTYFSSSPENSVLLSRSLMLDSSFNVPGQSLMLSVPYGGSTDKGELHIDIKTDPTTVPTNDTPG